MRPVHSCTVAPMPEAPLAQRLSLAIRHIQDLAIYTGYQTSNLLARGAMAYDCFAARPTVRVAKIYSPVRALDKRGYTLVGVAERVSMLYCTSTEILENMQTGPRLIKWMVL